MLWNDSADFEAAVPCFSSQASSEIIFPESEYIFPSGELNLCIVSARSSDALWITKVEKNKSMLLTFFHVVQEYHSRLVWSLSHLHVRSDGGVRHAVLARVLINDSLFVLCAVSLAVCIFKIAKMSSANVYLESKVCKRLDGCPCQGFSYMSIMPPPP